MGDKDESNVKNFAFEDWISDQLLKAPDVVVFLYFFDYLVRNDISYLLVFIFGLVNTEFDRRLNRYR